MNSTTSSPTNRYDLIQAAKQPIVYSFSVTITCILITSILNVSVLCRRTLRLSSCTYYFLASVPPVLALVIVLPLNLVLQNSSGIYINNTPITCKVNQYLTYTTPLLYASMLVCASIDRFCSSSTSVRLRQLSQVRVARRIIIIAWVLALAYMSPFMAIYYYDYNSNTCTQYSTTPIAAYLMTVVVLYYFLIPIMLGVFGSLTIYNIRSHTRRVAPVNQVNFHRRTESQLARMLIIQVAVYFLFFTPSGILYILVTFVPSMNTPYFITVRRLAAVWQQGGYFTAFFLYVLTGRIYRDELKKMLRWDQIRDQIVQLTVRDTQVAVPFDRA